MAPNPSRPDIGRFDKPYNPHEVEERWCPYWIEHGFSTADQDASTPDRFSIVIPPPNITGSLHLGHALNNTLQDILVRWKRMQGYNTLWLPGTDHAGIATQNVVERLLLAFGTDRETLGREGFIKRIWQWREESGRTIIQQLKRLGASCDWTRERFTMDDGLSAAVREVFVRLYEERLIYRGERLINWCPRCRTALSDIEVEHEEVQGKMYHITYPLADEPDTVLTVATTRPETMLGDTAVAVHPDDPRYNRLIGKKVSLPLTRRTIPIVGDSILVDRDFGTGAVKITPAEDSNDEKAGQRHNLQKIRVTDQGNKINPAIPDVDSETLGRIMMLDVNEARTLIAHLLREKGYLLKTEDHTHAIGTCYRCKTIVKWHDSPQWFINVNDPNNSLAKPAIEAVRSNRIRIIPEGWRNNYFGWMENIQDWCISRQIWWGHQIPAWYCRACSLDSMLHTTPDGTQKIGIDAKPIVSRAKPPRCPTCQSTELVQDPDVLDTWFSSALWPFSTLGWPEKTKDLSVYYPTSALVTSFDILFFWVARMIMMGLKFMGEVPFRDVYIHALVRDAEGQKMSKSRGNVIDPLEVMDRFGTDALRFTLASMASPGRDIKLSEDRIEGYRNFANKLWNAARFILMNLPEDYESKSGDLDEQTGRNPSPIHGWIRSRLDHCTKQVNEALKEYRFDEAARDLYQFIWHEYCDWYLELVKVDLTEGSPQEKAQSYKTLLTTFDSLLRLLHPFMPFITEELRQHFPNPAGSISVAPYPQAEGPAGPDEAMVEKLIQLVTAIRMIRNEHNIPHSAALKAYIKMDDAAFQNLAGPYARRLAKLSHLELARDIERPPWSVATPLSKGELYLSLQGVIDFAAEEARLRKKCAKIENEISGVEKKLNNPDFMKKASPDAITRTEGQYAQAKEQYAKASSHLEEIRSMRREK